ncbi:hypothetical protein, unlikely [Trypanosoma brucei gambiense DAL972]|uniref:Uncharacterized protein n=1 Tax=Trypanosoma brucei gambiense (strain MHOM/CI/86/DAL972) TaxID=679716 RepID=C9ZWM2_TRYB9|nr:hypothetical protein, unlikely [Trypanosoma brucei gambiense DAL972]CBH13811.1 hypothetical protein, unlikely [Trypanosoma brucei gambiense DAL972]|eukprot:XP_011776087.1 hypothetical protein, unlikely [Trypanosoma brucei gambiense DAL972]
MSTASSPSHQPACQVHSELRYSCKGTKYRLQSAKNINASSSMLSSFTATSASALSGLLFTVLLGGSAGATLHTPLLSSKYNTNCPLTAVSTSTSPSSRRTLCVMWKWGRLADQAR